MGDMELWLRGTLPHFHDDTADIEQSYNDLVINEQISPKLIIVFFRILNIINRVTFNQHGVN
jgi:hypothetical protein